MVVLLEGTHKRKHGGRADYNERRPRGALGPLTPSEHAQSGHEARLNAANL